MKNKDKYLFVIDNGHGGIVDGKYVTPGKRSPKWDDKTFSDGKPFVLYEGVNNRINAKLLIEEMERQGFNTLDLVDTPLDKSLEYRCDRTNMMSTMTDKELVYISIHSNAAGSDGNWSSARGISIHIHPNGSKNTRYMAECLSLTMKTEFKDLTKWRGIKENNFKVLRDTWCPAILLEVGFHDNKEDAELMLTDDWRNAFVYSVIEACMMYIR